MKRPCPIWLTSGLLLVGCTATEEAAAPPTTGVTPVEYPAPSPLVPPPDGNPEELARATSASAPLPTEPTPPEPPAPPRLYIDALRNERAYDYPAAIELYGAILQQRPDYLDVVERRNTLQALVELADDLYARAEDAPVDEELSLLRMIEVFWPSYEDVQERLEPSDG